MPSARTIRTVGAAALSSLTFAAFAFSSAKPAQSVAPNRPVASHGRASPLRTGRQMAGPTGSRRGRRVFAGATRDTSYSYNWSGYGGAGDLTGAQGTWTVPTVAADSGPPLYSSSWVGVDGFANSWLIQTGTAQNSSSAGRSYFPWFEIITPSDVAPETQIDAVVEPGDAITAEVVEQSSGIWQIYLADATRGWYFQQDYQYAGPGTSAEWIEEAPTVGGQQSSAANWGTVHFAGTGTEIGATWYSTDLTSANAMDLVNSGGKIIAAPGPISIPGNGQSFADVFGTPAPPPPAPKPKVTRPSPPTKVSAHAATRSIKLKWTAPKNAGGKKVTRYVINEYRGGKRFKVLHSRTTDYTARALSYSWRYAFTIAASNGTYTSAPSARTRRLRPLK
jgi:hypothetical protein